MEYIYKEFDGRTTIIDKEDEWVFETDYHWHAVASKYEKYYIIGFKQRNKINTSMFLARLIMGNPVNMLVDHKNHNTLDNRKENLRICTRSENSANSIIFKNNTSGYKGVRFHKKKWNAAIKSCGKIIHLGCFENIIDAALAYDKKAIEVFGEFAYLNFPNGTMHNV